MNAVWGVMGAIIITLLLIAGAVFVLGDRTILVSPPEAVVESFMRELATGRYDRALPHLSRNLAAQTDAAALRHLTDRLKSRTGEILDVRGEPGWISVEQAEASALLKTKSAGTRSLRLPLLRQQEAWAVSGPGALEADASE